MSDYVSDKFLIPENDSSLDLCLSLNYSTSSRKPQNDADKVAPEVENKQGELNKIFSCMYCNKKFTNPQSLGGHQNAHRSQREQMKKDKELQKMPISGSSIKTPMYPYATSSTSIYEPLHRPLGVDRSAFIHKPYPVNRLRLNYGRQVMQYMPSPQHSTSVPNAVQSWSPNAGFQAVKLNGFRPWIPIVLTNWKSSSQTLACSDFGASSN